MAFFNKEDFLHVLEDLYKHAYFQDDTLLPKHRKAHWVLPIFYDHAEKFQRLVAVETQYRQAVSIIRRLCAGVNVHGFDASAELIMTTLALSSDLRDATVRYGDIVTIEEFRYFGLEHRLNVSSSGRRALRKKYLDEETDIYYDVLAGGLRVNGGTILALVDAVDEFVNKE